MAELKTPQELGTEKIGKLLVRYAVPAIVAMLASSLYNIVDRAFIGHGVGPMALSGLAVTFPLMNLSAALGSMVGVGAGTMISLKLGQKDNRSAQILFGNAITMNVIIGITFGVMALIFLEPILKLFGATDATMGYAKEYMTIILIGNTFTHLYLGTNSVLRAAGHPAKAMTATIGTVLLNTLMDWLFIMVFGWGIRGAAIATVIAQVLAFTWQCFQLSDKSELIHLESGIFRLRGDLVRNIVTIGLSPCLMNAAACLVVLLINRGLLEHGGDIAVGAYSIINSMGFLYVMTVMGFTQAMQPIAGYNYGAKRYERVLSVFYKTLLCGTIVTTLGFFISELLPDMCIRIFTNDPELTGIARHGMRINFLVFPLIGSQIVISNLFQNMGMPGKSIIMSLSRQVLLLIPCLIILPRYYGIDGIWYSMPLSDAISVLLGIALIIPQIHKLKQMVKQENI
ncbi:MAG: MATE family efflux transporter [Bacteroidaceae bacterium]|nr:MATE family efflux transporter [Bacteroidaceae bacterium]